MVLIFLKKFSVIISSDFALHEKSFILLLERGSWKKGSKGGEKPEYHGSLSLDFRTNTDGFGPIENIGSSADIIILLSSNGGLVMAWSAPFFFIKSYQALPPCTCKFPESFKQTIDEA